MRLSGQDLSYKFYKYDNSVLTPITLTGSSYVVTETGIYIVVFTTVNTYDTHSTYDPAEPINIRKLVA